MSEISGLGPSNNFPEFPKDSRSIHRTIEFSLGGVDFPIPSSEEIQDSLLNDLLKINSESILKPAEEALRMGNEDHGRKV